jgi:hypothetical protein
MDLAPQSEQQHAEGVCGFQGNETVGALQTEFWAKAW